MHEYDALLYGGNKESIYLSSQDWFCNVYKLSSLPAKQKKSPFKIYGERNQCKVQNMYPSLFELPREGSFRK